MIPRLVVTAGLHGSASTSLFNIVRELMVEAVGAEHVVAVYGEDLSSLPAPLTPDHRHVVLKSHGGGPAWAWLVWLSRAPIVLSIRDPRDAVLSLMERFGNTLEQATRALLADCACATHCAVSGAVPLRYEDRFFQDLALPARLAAQLGLDVPEATCRAIAARYTTEGVRAHAANLADLPPGRAVQGGGMHYDTVTQIHHTHIGNGLVGKWRDRLTPEQGAALTRAFAPFLARFGYPA